MPYNRPDDEQLLTRLLSLTTQGQLPWQEAYDQHAFGQLGGGLEENAASTRPAGYALFDDQYHFGAVSIRFEDPMNEIYEPVLFLQGRRAEVRPEDLQALIDAVRVYLDEVRLGERPTLHEYINEKVQEALGPMQSLLHKIEQRNARQASWIDRHIGLLESAMDNSNTPPPPVPFSTDTFVCGLRHLLGEEYDEDFARFYDRSRCEQAVRAALHEIRQYPR